MYFEKRLSKLEDNVRKCISALKRIEANQKTKSFSALKDLGYKFTPQMEEEYILLLAKDVGLLPPKDGENWESNIFYAQDTIIKDGENLKRCLKPHMSTNIEEINDDLIWVNMESKQLPWSEPENTYDSYMAGDIVECEGKLFKSTVDGNLNVPEPLLKKYSSLYDINTREDFSDNYETKILKIKADEELIRSQSSWEELKEN